MSAHPQGTNNQLTRDGRPSPPVRRYPLLHASAGVLATALRAVPRRHRFKAALVIARALTPAIALTTMHRELRGQRVDGSGEIAVYRLLDAMTTWGTEFDPLLRFEGGEEFLAAARNRRGLLIISPHAMLGTIVLRRLDDLGVPASVVAADANMRVLGTSRRVDVIVPSPAFMIGIARRLRDGGTVVAAIDRGDPTERRAIRIDTA